MFESAQALAKKEKTTIEKKFSNELSDIKNLKGEEKLRQIKVRVNQAVFRGIVLRNYNEKCAISGINIPSLLTASHIIPWSVNENERLNPENGICLSPLYDRAFDRGLIGINKNYAVMVSSKLKKYKIESYYKNYFSHLDGLKISVPEKYKPSKDFLDYHLDKVFNKNL
jgi:putative restriction endonuclease